MKRFLSLLAIMMMVISANAQEYTWKKVTGTSVPDDFYEGVTAEEAKEYLDENWLEGTLYGSIPADGMFSAYLCTEDTDYDCVYGTISWADAAANGIMYYPAKKSSTPGSNNCTLNENDNIADNYQTGDTFDKLTLTRSMKRYLSDGTTKRWHTIAFPFTMSAEQIEANFGSGTKLMELTSISDNTLNFETATSIEEETLYLLQLGDLSADVEKIELENVTMTSVYGKYGTDFDVMPTFEPATLDEDFFYVFYVLANNEIHKVDSEVTVNATRWYIKAELEDSDWDWSKTLQFSLDGEITSISALHLNEADSANKRIENNRVVIRKGNKSYTTTGVEVK